MGGYAKVGIHLMPNLPEESNEPLVEDFNVKAKAECVGRLYTIVPIIVIYIYIQHVH